MNSKNGFAHSLRFTLLSCRTSFSPCFKIDTNIQICPSTIARNRLHVYEHRSLIVASPRWPHSSQVGNAENRQEKFLYRSTSNRTSSEKMEPQKRVFFLSFSFYELKPHVRNFARYVKNRKMSLRWRERENKKIYLCFCHARMQTRIQLTYWCGNLHPGLRFAGSCSATTLYALIDLLGQRRKPALKSRGLPQGEKIRRCRGLEKSNTQGPELQISSLSLAIQSVFQRWTREKA